MLNALTNQSEAKSNETIIVDGGSTDGTQEIVQKYRVTLLKEKKPGPGSARNLGLRHATGDVIVHLDADTIPTRRWLSELIEPFADPNVVLVGGKILDYLGETPAQRYTAASGLHDPRKNIRRQKFPFVPSINMAVRRENALSIGGWSEELLTSEDVDFSYRILRDFSTRITYAPKAVLFHRNRRTDGELRYQAWTYGEGAAHFYLIHSDVLSWDLPKKLRLARRVGYLQTVPTLIRVAKVFGLASDEHLEFAYYDRFWTAWFSRGFLSYLKHKTYRQLPDPNSMCKLQAMKSSAKGTTNSLWE